MSRAASERRRCHRRRPVVNDRISTRRYNGGRTLIRNRQRAATVPNLQACRGSDGKIARHASIAPLSDAHSSPSWRCSWPDRFDDPIAGGEPGHELQLDTESVGWDFGREPRERLIPLRLIFDDSGRALQALSTLAPTGGAARRKLQNGEPAVLTEMAVERDSLGDVEALHNHEAECIAQRVHLVLMLAENRDG